MDPFSAVHSATPQDLLPGQLFVLRCHPERERCGTGSAARTSSAAAVLGQLLVDGVRSDARSTLARSRRRVRRDPIADPTRQAAPVAPALCRVIAFMRAARSSGGTWRARADSVELSYAVLDSIDRSTRPEGSARDQHPVDPRP